MPVNNPLLVPIEVEAYVVNNAVLANKEVNIQRWQFNYPFLNKFTTPQPKAFTGTNDLPGTGVILHWTLPDILRNGVQDADGSVHFPLVPNRWLVVRYSGPAAARTAVAWVVQSDALGDDDPVSGGAPFLDPHSTDIQPTSVGKVVALTNWKEPEPPSLFLKAIAPGNNMFASFQPYCWNVFSLFDPLTNVAAQDTLSYLVAGWYSKASDDITGSWEKDGTFAGFLDKTFWELAKPSIDTATNAIYHSMMWDVKWDINAAAPSNAPKGKEVKVAIGNTTTEALTALIKAQAPASIDADLLEALQYDLLPAYDMSDWEFELKQHIEASWFGSHDGGDAWEINNKPIDPQQGNPPPPLSPIERAAEETWLGSLNRLQAQYDMALRSLPAMQWELYQVWWKYRNAQANGLTSPYPVGTSQAQFEAALDPNNEQGLLYQVNNLKNNIRQLRAAIDSFVERHKTILPVTRELKQFARRPFNWAYDPVLLMHGLKNDATLTPVARLKCRFMSQLVTAFQYNGSPISLAQVTGVIPAVENLQAVPMQLSGLIGEFFLLDPGNATMIAMAALSTSDPAIIAGVAAAMNGGRNVTADSICPDLDLDPWLQPWSPLVMLWDIVFYPIPHDNGVAPLWEFDGNEYTWNGNGFDSRAPVRELQSMIFLTPKASFNFKAQIAKFIKENADNADMKELEKFMGEVDHWDFLSQSLAGLTALFNLRNTDPNVSASLDARKFFGNMTLADLVGGSATYAPIPGDPFADNAVASATSGFQQWRAGQFLIRRLSVVDAFGQTCEVVNSQTEKIFVPILSPSLQPQVPVISQQSARLVQLCPRILQPGRLNLDFVGAGTNNGLAIDDDANPIIAFLLHNYLDESIACYDSDGLILGSVWIITNDAQVQEVNWFAAPDSPIRVIDDMIGNVRYPALNDLGLMLQAMKRLGPAAFNSMLETMDKANLTIDGTLTTADTGMLLLAGQPLAMAKLQVQFELEGPVITDPSWPYTFTPEPNPVTGWEFTVRLGETGQRSDGLVGYFSVEGYEVFYTPNLPDQLPDPQYIKSVGRGDSIKLPFDPGSVAYLTVLMDPRATVHATTGILPVASIGIPQDYINHAFARIDLTFEIGPLLTDMITPEVLKVGDRPSIVMPQPALKNGTWSWQQFNGSGWDDFEIKPVQSTAQFSNVSPIIRQGLLRLTGAVKI